MDVTARDRSVTDPRERDSKWSRMTEHFRNYGYVGVVHGSVIAVTPAHDDLEEVAMHVRRKKRPEQSAQSILHQLSEVRHNADRDRFELYVAGDLVGVLGYSVENVGGQTVLTVLHTVLYDEFTGHGLASRLTTGVLQYVVDSGAKVRPVCTFTRHFLTTHPSYAAVAV
jgi:predicted GNAT family acetyltransferase